MIRVLFFIFSVCGSAFTYSHSGGLDVNGGHTQKSTQTYHCHKPSCKPLANTQSDLSQHASLERETQQAQAEGRAYSLLYSRKDWPHWIDADGDCQDTRAEVLIALSRQAVKFKRNVACNVSHGEWLDPYTGKMFYQASDLDIDHIVPLSWAHKHGAANWSREQKRAFANDPENLIAVDKVANREKGDKGPNMWMPVNRDYRKEYLEKFELIVRKYNLDTKE